MPRSDRNWRRILIASDLHGPYLDRRAYSVFLGVCSEFEWDQVILNGDVADFSQISRHDPKLSFSDAEFRDDISLDEELHTIKVAIFGPLRHALGRKTKIKMRLGNHERRFDEVLASNSRAVLELLKTIRRNKSPDLEGLLDIDRYGIELSRRRVDRINNFTIIHGVKTSKNVAKANLLRYGSGTSGHTHRMGIYTEVMHGKLQGWFESGCLRTIHDIEYLPYGDIPDWAHGFLELHIHPSGEFHCIPHFVINHRTIFNGQTFAG